MNVPTNYSWFLQPHAVGAQQSRAYAVLWECIVQCILLRVKQIPNNNVNLQKCRVKFKVAQLSCLFSAKHDVHQYGRERLNIFGCPHMGAGLRTGGVEGMCHNKSGPFGHEARGATFRSPMGGLLFCQVFNQHNSQTGTPFLKASFPPDQSGVQLRQVGEGPLKKRAIFWLRKEPGGSSGGGAHLFTPPVACGRRHA